MTTDNRTNEPSHNRITIQDFRDGEVSVIREDRVRAIACTLDELKRAVATYEARAALVAAQGAAPAPSSGVDEDKLDAVRRLHRRINVMDEISDERMGEECETCGRIEGYELEWPCPTIRAIEDALRGEGRGE